MTLEELANKVENIWQTLRRHKHHGQAIDLTEELDDLPSASLSPSASVSASAGGADIGLFDSFVDLIHWQSKDGYTETVNVSGSASVNDGYLSLDASGGSGAYCFLQGKVYYNILEAGKQTTVEWQISNVTDTTQLEVFMYMSEGVDFPPTTDRHFGFKIDDGQIYTSTADGTTESTSASLGAIGAAEQRSRFKAVAIRGTSIKYYVDGALVKTETSNLPDIAKLRLNMGVKSTDANQSTVLFNRVLIQKEY